jgi:hypothetical protein
MGDLNLQNLHLVLGAKIVKSRLGHHQINKQFGPADGELKADQTIWSDLPDANKFVFDLDGDFFDSGG